ncbi:DUF4835 family protein [Paramuribaculum intestinale]|uniref:DUF4835 domain-containing protein n=3 Tax=Paramuribaculum intestinale TaxID=2094151 RepID=A0A2V1IY63_9BACT|nr:DUF4835 family protein [Paramuribaculum intestinale]ROS94585.1 DUF4835 family protein [Muribaculaceae bacterium Isolate-043 (Harlan)]MCX4330023.1 DUF4835 family protein [Paramuribaculum intestinale]PWB07356.1 DUF4835 domain-containing protein [Paramuribaculum intestinale]PWB12507.1 DUF4835 domain-containing protein [Paramuribaculum intestinale]WLT42016.1 DUF4835 family protein [Paramuribaculum intestinale]
MKRMLLTLVAFAAAVAVALCSELNCKVEVNVSRTETMPSDVARQLQEAVAEYVNTTSFTELRIAPGERIECRMFFDVQSYADDKVSAVLTVQSTRPVYDSSYTTTLLNVRDAEVEFPYSSGQPLVFARDAIDSELTALLDFYVYLILAVDADSFAPEGGTPFYGVASQIVTLARSSGGKGWRAIDSPRNRASLLAALTEPPTAAFRTLLYDYHRRGLDVMTVSPEKGRATIGQTLQRLRDMVSQSPMTPLAALMRDAKLDEFVGLYSKASDDERREAAALLTALWPSESEAMEKIKNPRK